MPRADARYRDAASRAAETAGRLGVVELRLEHFLSDFVASGPQNEQEMEVFYDLARLYRSQGFPENAEEVIRKIAARDPGFRDVAEILAAGEGAGTSLPGLPELTPPEALPALPDLPPEPMPPPGPAAGRGGTQVLPAGLPGSSFRVGSTIAGRYRLEDEIGRGGMATVFWATDLELQESVALKVFNQSVADEAALDRFRQEIRLSRRLSHPNVVRLHDIGSFEGFRYISMELLQGATLATVLGQPMDLACTVDYLIQACAGLQAAHDQGIVHRDVKPANLFITLEGRIKVMDFGIAKERSAPGLTVAGMIIGTPEYIAPEQIRGFSSVGPPADLYSLGVVAYEMLTGSVPFRHDEMVPLLMMHLQDPPQPPRRLRPDLPPDLDRIVLRLLEKQPESRFASCRELAAALGAVSLG